MYANHGNLTRRRSGPCYVVYRPARAGTLAQFTPVGAASNHEAVDEAGASDGDATYNVADAEPAR